MAGNTRGRLKEHFEGIHKNFDWIVYHCQSCLTLIMDKNPTLSKAIKALAKGVEILDKVSQGIYSKI